MIQVSMGDENALDLLRGSPQAGDVPQGLFIAERHPSVDNRQAIGFENEVGVGLYIWDDLDVIDDLHLRSFNI